jgi:hypothetical protein
MLNEHYSDRRSFLRTGAIASTAFAAGPSTTAKAAGGPAPGDDAILRFLSALEQIEADLWLQYNELGGI